jgi:hypothetical protein
MLPWTGTPSSINSRVQARLPSVYERLCARPMPLE